MKRFAVYSEGINVYMDGRTFAKKQTAQKHLESFLFCTIGNEAEIKEVEAESDREKIARLESQLKEARTLVEMVQDNTKMPHQHTDPQLRLYCLAERATEFLAKYPEDEE